jgi:hypothetical protein
LALCACSTPFEPIKIATRKKYETLKLTEGF